METRCQKSTCSERQERFTYSLALSFPLDSKAVSAGRTPLVCTFLRSGLERAFSEAPENSRALRFEAVRRDL